MINIDIVNISGADRGWLWSLSRRLRSRDSSLLSSQVMFFKIILFFLFVFLVKSLEHWHYPAVQPVFDVCPLFSSLLVVLESSRQNHNRPTKLFCRYTRLAQARSSSGHENHLSSQVDKISRDEKRDKLASPDLIPGEKERRWFFCQGITLIPAKELNDWLTVDCVPNMWTID